MIERPHVDEGRGADLQPVGFPPSRADDVEAEFTLVGLRPAIDLPGRRIEPPRKQHKLLDHRFQIRKHPILWGEGDARHIRHDRTFGRNLIQTLTDDLQTLPHFLHANPIPIVGIPVLPHRHAELALRVRCIALVFPKIVIHSRPPQGGTAEPEADRILCRNDSHTLGPGEPDAVLLEKDHVLINLRWEIVQEFAKLLHQRGREIPLDSANPIPACGEPGAAQFIKPVQQNLAISECIEEDGHCPDVQRLGSEPELVSDDPLDFRDDGAEIVGTLGDCNIH